MLVQTAVLMSPLPPRRPLPVSPSSSTRSARTASSATVSRRLTAPNYGRKHPQQPTANSHVPVNGAVDAAITQHRNGALLIALSCQYSALRRNQMPYIAGVLTGVLLTIFVVFLVDNLAVTSAPSGTEPQKIVNWDVAAQKLRSSITTVNKEVHELREDVHEATR